MMAGHPIAGVLHGKALAIEAAQAGAERTCRRCSSHSDKRRFFSVAFLIVCNPREIVVGSDPS